MNENSSVLQVEQGQCGVCYITGPLMEIQNHFLTNHVTNDVTVEPSQQKEVQECENTDDESKFHWSNERVLLLIRLVEKHEKEFQQGLKKNVWVKIANEMSSVAGKNISFDQVDSKWKGLKKTYKNVKDHNKKSGNTPKKWPFYNAMDSFMRNKPEIDPVATCSSVSPIVITNKDTNNGTDSESASESNVLKTMKRKGSDIQKRHKEKMVKYDKFLKLFKLSVEHQIGKKVQDSDDDDD